MKTILALLLLVNSQITVAEESILSSYWKTASISEVAKANAEISNLLGKVNKEIKQDSPDYNQPYEDIEAAKAMCYAMHCKASKSVCAAASGAYRSSGLVAIYNLNG